jgi:type IV pilus assembly protein PilC
MPTFVYSARDIQGKKIKGKVEAKAKEVAANILRERKLFIVSLHESGDTGLAEIQNAFARVKSDDIVNFTRQLATMINAGLPLIQAFSVLENQSSPAMSKVIRSLQRDVEGGANLGVALGKQGKIFNKIYISLVQAGEAAGALDTILNRLADTLEKQKEFRSKTKGALIYPGIVMTAMGIVAVVMMIFVIPKMTEMYTDFGAELPAATQLLIDLSDFFSQQWYIPAGFVFLFAFVFRSWHRTKTGAYQFDRFLLRVPVYGNLRQKILVTEFARTLSLLISAGISLLEALDIVIGGIDNLVFRRAIEEARADVEKGQALSRSIEKSAVFPILLPQMIAVGEETGKMDDVLTKLATYYDRESEYAVKGLTTALEPLIMIVLGLGVGFLIVAIVLPIYNLTSQF